MLRYSSGGSRLVAESWNLTGNNGWLTPNIVKSIGLTTLARALSLLSSQKRANAKSGSGKHPDKPEILDNSEQQPTDKTVIACDKRRIAPFIPSHDITRGLVHALQALLAYMLMLAIMLVLLL